MFTRNDIQVIHASTYGSTRAYANWIAASLNCKCTSLEDARERDFPHVHTIIFGGAVYAGQVKGLRFLKSLMKEYPDIKFILYTCGVYSPDDKEHIEQLRSGIQRSLTDRYMDKLEIHHVQGAIHHKRLSFLHKLVIKILVHSIKRKDPQARSLEEQSMLGSYGQVTDFKDPCYVDAITKSLSHSI